MSRTLSLFVLFAALALIAVGCASPTVVPTSPPAPAPTTAPIAAPTSAPVATVAPAPAPTQAPAPTTAPTAAPTTAPTTASAQPVRGGIAVIATDSDPDQLNPGLTTSYNIGDIGSKIFNGLVWIDPNWTPQPQLAESWTISSDAMVYTFKLRSGVTWHDGQPFNSADVKYSFDEILLKLHPRTKGLAPRITSITAPDAQTVVFTLNAPYAPFLLGLSVLDAPILPKHLYDGQGDVTKNPANLKPVGTGPFKFSEWNKGSTLKLVRNENYFEKGLPYLDGLVYQIIPQAANRSTALETGEVDYVVDFYFPKTDVKRMESSGKYNSKHGQAAPAIEFMMFNTRTKALATKEARQAIAMVIDRKRIVDQAMNSIARLGYGPFGDGFKWLLNTDAAYDKLYPLNVAKAKTMLDAAGVTAGSDGSRGTLRLIVDTARAPHVTAAQIIKENLKDIGFNVDIQALERSVMIQKVFLDWDYDLTLQSFVSSGDPAIGYHRLYVTATTKAQFTNQTGYSNSTVDDLLNKAATAPLQKDRAVFYQNVQTILSADLPSLVLFDDEGVDFASKKLNGLFVGIDSRDRFDLVWMSK
ncbi:MAG TPA: ABC transporter substrate-binding protein [Anaerolineae bacterium]